MASNIEEMNDRVTYMGTFHARGGGGHSKRLAQFQRFHQEDGHSDDDQTRPFQQPKMKPSFTFVIGDTKLDINYNS